MLRASDQNQSPLLALVPFCLRFARLSTALTSCYSGHQLPQIAVRAQTPLAKPPNLGQITVARGRLSERPAELAGFGSLCALHLINGLIPLPLHRRRSNPQEGIFGFIR